MLDLEETSQRFQVAASLQAAGDDADGRTFGAGQVFRGYGGGRAGALGGDPGAIHDGQRDAGLRIVEDEKAADVREPLGLVVGVAGYPFHPGGLEAGDVGGHGVYEGVGAGVDAGFGRHLYFAIALFAEHGFQRVDDFHHRQVNGFDISAGEVEKGVSQFSVSSRKGSTSRRISFKDSEQIFPA